jgi:hypothetical protein
MAPSAEVAAPRLCASGSRGDGERVDMSVCGDLSQGGRAARRDGGARTPKNYDLPPPLAGGRQVSSGRSASLPIFGAAGQNAADGGGRPAPGCASAMLPDVLLDGDHSGHGETMNRAVVGIGAGRRELAGVRARTLERRHDRRVRVECHRVDDIAREPHPRDQCVDGDRQRVGREEIVADVDRVGARHRAAATAGGCAAAARRTWRHADDPRGSGRRSAACRRHNYRHECRDYREIPHPHPPLHQDESTKTNAPGRKQYSARFPAQVCLWGERQFPRGGRCRKSLNFTLAEPSRIAAEQAGSSFQQSE